MRIDRIIYFPLSFAALVWGVRNLDKNLGTGLHALALLAFLTGTYVFAHLCMAEGRDRERRRRGDEEKP
jgi:hypothetical protein